MKMMQYQLQPGHQKGPAEETRAVEDAVVEEAVEEEVSDSVIHHVRC